MNKIVHPLILVRRLSSIPSRDSNAQPAPIPGFPHLVQHMKNISGKPALAISPRLPAGLIYSRIMAGHPQDEIADDLCIDASLDVINEIFKQVKEYGDSHPEIIDD